MFYNIVQEIAVECVRNSPKLGNCIFKVQDMATGIFVLNSSKKRGFLFKETFEAYGNFYTSFLHFHSPGHLSRSGFHIG